MSIITTITFILYLFNCLLTTTETAVVAQESHHANGVFAMAVNVSWAVRIEAVVAFARIK